MFQINSIIKDTIEKHEGNTKKALNEIRLVYPEYYKTAKNLIEGCSDAVKMTEDFMTEFFEHNKFLEGVINYENYYEIYNIPLDKDGIPLDDVDKVTKAIEKEINKKKKDKNKALEQVFTSIEEVEKTYASKDYEGLETQQVSFCPLCGQVALGKHKCKNSVAQKRPEFELY